MGFEKLDLNQKNPLYEKALGAANIFLPKINPDLKAKIVFVKVKTYDGKEYDTTALEFEDGSNPAIKWTMEVGEDKAYFEGAEFENSVRRAYEDQKNKNIPNN